MVTRRIFLQAGGATVFAAGLTALPAFIGRAAQAATLPAAARNKVLVVVYQCFGMDGLLAVTPYTSQSLAKLRPNLMGAAPGSAKEDALVDLNGEFALHPALASLAPMFREGSLAIVHGSGSPNNSRSHLDARQWWESGTPGDKATADGWLNRALSVASNGEGRLLRTVAMTPEQPRILYGEQTAVAITDLSQLEFGLGQADSAMRRVQQLYANSENAALRKAGTQGFEITRILSAAKSSAGSAVAYPNSAFANGLRDIAQLIKADVGLQVAFAESRSGTNGKGSWDTHSKAREVNGQFSFPPIAEDFSKSIAAFWQDLGSRRDDVAVVTLTDFGRNVVENVGVGADHGRATAMFVLSTAVKGGKVYGTLPERFERDALEDQMDLPVTTDYRSVIAEVAGRQLGIATERDGVLFPGWHGARLPLMRA